MTTPFASLTPPEAPREPRDVTVHGDPRSDDWFWLRDRDDPRTLPYLRAENAYAEAWFEPHAALKETLYQEMFSRIQQDDNSVPYRKGDWWYATRIRSGEQYPVYLRRRAAGADRAYDASGSDEVLLDLNELARGQPFLRIGLFAVTRDAMRLAYTSDLTGGRDYTLHLRDLATGVDDAWSVPEVSSAAWANDGRTLFYVTMDEAKRANKLWRHVLDAEGPDALVLEEPDELFDLDIGRTRDGRWLIVTSESKDSNEQQVIDADVAAEAPVAGLLRMVFPRRPDLECHLDHRAGRFYVLVNDTGRNFRLVSVDAAEPDLAHAVELIPARDRVMLDDADLFAEHLVVTERVDGNLRLHVFDLVRGGDHVIAFDEAAYEVGLGANPEFETTVLRFGYESMTAPESTFDYDMVARTRVLRKQQPVPGYDAALYESARTVATAADGTEVPVSLVWRKDQRLPGPQALLLYGYGSYGLPMDPWFSSARVSLLDRGAIFAIAHVRGGGDLGRTWYEAAKMGTKTVTFGDFIACAEALIAQGWTRPSQLAIEGGSAGGLLMGAVVNLRPELFKAVIAEVPFVDVINTMLDETLPLTVGEFIEWGNPKLPEQYAWLKAYSPYDNLKRGAFPAMFVRTGLNDSQVAYWEPAKYVAKLRTLKTDANPLLMKINLEVGHGGASGRFDSLREVAEDDAFLLAQWGLAG